MKWAHIINISILFDCPPNKSHCSNKQRAPLRCLPLSGAELSTRQLAIYYRHLSQVTDKHRDGCRILQCQNGFISPPSKLLSRADELCLSSLLWLSSSHLSDANHCQCYPSKSPFHQEQMYSIIYWFSYPCTLWLLPFSPIYSPVFMCVSVSAPTPVRMTLQAYASVHVPGQCSQHPSRTSNCVFSMMPVHVVILRSKCNILLLRKPSYQSSQLLLANLKARLTCCSFSFY